MSEQSIVDYFDPSNKDHLKAFVILQDTGMWPEGFFPNPESIKIPIMWYNMIVGKIVDYYLKEKGLR